MNREQRRKETGLQLLVTAKTISSIIIYIYIAIYIQTAADNAMQLLALLYSSAITKVPFNLGRFVCRLCNIHWVTTWGTCLLLIAHTMSTLLIPIWHTHRVCSTWLHAFNCVNYKQSYIFKRICKWTLVAERNHKHSPTIKTIIITQ